MNSRSTMLAQKINLSMRNSPLRTHRRRGPAHVYGAGPAENSIKLENEPRVTLGTGLSDLYQE